MTPGGGMQKSDVEAVLVMPDGSDEELTLPTQTEPQWRIRPGALLIIGAAATLAIVVGRSSATSAMHTSAVVAEVAVWTEAPPFVLSVALNGFDRVGDRPCTSESYLSGERQDSREKCAMTCKANPDCKFVAYCPSGQVGCTGPQENNCVRYGSCDAFDADYQGYTAFKLAESTHRPSAHHHNTAHAASMSVQTAPSQAPVVHANVMKNFENIGDRPCTSTSYLGGEQRASQEACSETCTNDPQCNFIAFCPSGEKGCTGPQENNCVRYSSCDDFDPGYHGYTTHKYIRPGFAPLEKYKADFELGFDFYAWEPCVGDSQNMLGGERQKSEETCMLTCKDVAECVFVSYCPEGKHGCLGPQKNNCVRYRSCSNLDSNYHGYTTHVKKSFG